jgi:hypothetical protein
MKHAAKLTAMSLAVCTALTLGVGGAFAATAPAAAPVHHAARNHGHLKFMERPALIRDAAKWLKITPEELRTDLKSGQSVAQVAQAKGESESSLIAALTQDVNVRLQKLVHAHHMRGKRAQRLEAKLEARLQRFVQHAKSKAIQSSGTNSHA